MATAIDLDTLGAALQGELILPGSARYDSARVLFNAAYDYIRPIAIVRAATIADVQAAVNVARDNLVQIAIRGGGHSFAGYSTGPGILLDMSQLNSVSVDLGAETVRVGAGGKLIDITAELASTNLAIPSGWCPTVGVAGLALGGGIGKLTRLYGLTCDSLLGLDLVTADGRTMRADPDNNPDVFWACRGGGGGNFGVVTALDFQLQPVDFTCNRFEWTWPWSARTAAFEAFQQWILSTPRAATGTFTFTTAPPGSATPRVETDAVLFGPPAEAERMVAEFEASVGTPPDSRSEDAVDYLTLQKDTFCKDVSIAQCRWNSQSPIGALDRNGNSTKSQFIDGTWPSAAVDILAEHLERRQADPTLTREPFGDNKGKVWIEVMGGAVTDVGPEATAFAHREASFAVQYQSRWSPDAAPRVRAANVAWLRDVYAAMGPFHNGTAYVNYPDPDLGTWAGQYYGGNYSRLTEVKGRVDPHNLFNFQQSVGAPGAA